MRKLEELDIDYQRLKIKRDRSHDKLRQMIRYADQTGCRHRFILQYFGDAEAADQCTACDRCLARANTAARLPDDEEVVHIQKALSCVARMSGRFGRGRVSQVLAGSRNKEVLDAGLDQLSTYGLLAELGTDYVWNLLDVLSKAGCIATSAGRYPTLSLTPLGEDVMQLRKSIPLDLPSRPAPRTAERTKAKKSGTALTDAEGPYDMTLFDELKKWRRKKSVEMGYVKAFLIYSDRTLRDLARIKPETAWDLQKVNGIGPAKAQRFGEETLAVIKGHEGGL